LRVAAAPVVGWSSVAACGTTKPRPHNSEES
jgi:hypothetical protein